ncbi:MAG: hypothetical protein GY944_23360 [bacterium]|nr:hypothetical protein [bacterium]
MNFNCSTSRPYSRATAKTWRSKLRTHIMTAFALSAFVAPVDGQNTGGCVLLFGIDAEDGHPGGHGGAAPYANVITSGILANTAGPTTMLVIGGGKSATDDVTEFFNQVGTLTVPALTVTHVNGAAAIDTVSFAGFRVVAVASDRFNTPGGGLTNAENDALTARAGDIATHVNSGGGLFGLTQSGLTTKFGYVGDLGGFTVSNTSFSQISPTAVGTSLGISATNLDICCWHNEFLTFPAFLDVLATNDATLEACAIGGCKVIIPTREVCVNKDLMNSTGLDADCIDILLEGSFTSTLSTFNGGFPTFTITPVGPNTRFRWSGLLTPNGTVRHVGFCVTGDTVKILGVFWSFGGIVVGCAPQCNTLYGTHKSGTGTLVYANNATSCAPQPLFVGNQRFEHYATPPGLNEMVNGGARRPLRVDTLPGVVAIPVDQVVAIARPPIPPAGAVFTMLAFDVSTSPTLANPTGDFIMAPIFLRGDWEATATPYGVGCVGATPLTQGSTRPVLNSILTLTVSNIPSNSIAGVELLGFVQNPGIDLGFLGMPGCFLLTVPVLDSIPFSTAGNSAMVQLPVAGNAALIGAVLGVQAATITPSLNALGVASSNGVMLTFGL